MITQNIDFTVNHLIERRTRVYGRLKMICCGINRLRGRMKFMKYPGQGGHTDQEQQRKPAKTGYKRSDDTFFTGRIFTQAIEQIEYVCSLTKVLPFHCFLSVFKGM